ncbi:MAG: hypothetical protein ACLQMO_13560 [Acidobacteriaceae bacterium]
MPALPTAITGRAISITAFSWASVHGPTGATVTAGAAIASAEMVVEGITAVARPIADVQAAHRKHAPATGEGPTRNPPQVVPMSRQRVVAHPMLHPTQRQRVVAVDLTVAVADLMVGEGPMMVVGTSSR